MTKARIGDHQPKKAAAQTAKFNSKCGLIKFFEMENIQTVGLANKLW